MADNDDGSLQETTEPISTSEVKGDGGETGAGGMDGEAHRKQLKEANTALFRHLETGVSLDKVRENFFTYLEIRERSLFAVSDRHHPLENATIRACIFALKSIIGPINEESTGVSALEYLWKWVQGRSGELKEEVSPGFLAEFIHVFRGVDGKSGIYREADSGKRKIPEFLRLKDREAALKRSDILDEEAAVITERSARYPSGLGEEVIARREANRKRILAYFKGTESDWTDYRWHLDHVVKNAGILSDLIDLTPEQVEAVDIATKNKIPFGVTPYYLGLMDKELEGREDHAVRAQVIPPPDYVAKMAAHKQDRATYFDFMGEHDTSPADLITRRYPRIAILKPYNTCSQICVYCQRNWEIEECLDPNAKASDEMLEKALSWFAEHPGVGEVLVTGGDPIVTDDAFIEKWMAGLAAMKHIYRIRIGTRTPVVLPFRWTDSLIDILSRYHEPGVREVCVVIHFSHSYEITPEARDAVRKIRKAGIGVYNQQVFTIENSRRFETVKLRLDMRSIGVDPYYTFNMKGKEETGAYLVPIARILQERKEEARLLPGMDRTDEPVFNVPKLGKNHLRAWQDHRIIMIRPDGRRVYEFHPWEKNLALVPPYLYTDASIHEYLERLKDRGEDIGEYRTIWYYF